jgi:hypothetical protein
MPRSTSPGFHSAPMRDMTSPTNVDARDARHHGIVPAILRRDHEALGLDVAQGQVRRPCRVIGLHRDERDVERGVELLRLVDVQRLGLGL